MKPIRMIKKMGKQIYVAPRLEVLLFIVEPVWGVNSYPEVGDEENGEFLGKESIFDISDFPDDQSVWGLWDEDEE